MTQYRDVEIVTFARTSVAELATDSEQFRVEPAAAVAA